MKKFLTALLASIMAIIMCMFVGCDAPKDATYGGNYTETDTETLTESLSSLGSLNQFTPTEESNAGVSFNISIKSKSTTKSTTIYKNQDDSESKEPEFSEPYESESVIDVNASLSGKVISKYDAELGSIPLGNISAKVSNNQTDKDDIGKTVSKLNLGADLYLNSDGIFAEASQNASQNGVSAPAQSIKVKMGWADVKELIAILMEEMMGSMQGSGVTLPDMNEITDQDIINGINFLSENLGIRFALDASDGIKIKMDLSDPDKFVDAINSNAGVPEETNIDVNINKMELYLIFDKDGNFSAFKFAFAYVSTVEQTYDYEYATNTYSNTMSGSLSAEIKFYTGDVSLPTIDPDEYMHYSELFPAPEL